MTITLQQISKKFQRHWIFRDINYAFAGPGAYALLGHNGSGKSTLLRIIAGMQAPSAGKVLVTSENGTAIESGNIHPLVSFCAPGMELVEELTLQEFFEFHYSFKPLLPGFTIAQVITTIGLQQAASKLIGDYSSGMKQRVKLAQAIFTHTPVLLLDEPCTNLDQKGIAQYREWITAHAAGRLVIVASNDEREYFFCTHQLDMETYK